MLKEEIDFPRGGKKHTESNKADRNLPTEKDQKKRGAETEKKKQKQKLSRKRLNAEESPFDNPVKRFKKESTNVDNPLKDEDLCSDIVVLGCVKEVHSHNILVSLPCNRNASVPITNISEAYSQLLSQLSEEDEVDLTDTFVPAANLFKPGFYLPVALKSISEGKKGSKSIGGSLKPQDINAGRPKSQVKNGMLFMASVSSVEDHGYKIDVGIKGLAAFLKNSDAESYINKCCPGKQLCIGQPLWCVVKGLQKTSANENRVVNVVIDPEVIKKSKIQDDTQMNGLSPGLKCTAYVTTVAQQGLLVTFEGFEAIIHASHLPSALSSYKAGSNVEAAVLYVHPETKIIQLTALNQIINNDGRPIDMFKIVALGDIFDAKIKSVVKKRGIDLKLAPGIKGFAALSQLTDESDAPDITKYMVGQGVKCRVMGFNHMEGLVLVTLKQSILDEKFISVNSMVPGEFVEAKITDVLPAGVSVKVSRSIYTFISSSHLANVPITQLEKKFEPGMVLKCRVMSVNKIKSKVYLTHKKALMKPKNLIPTDYTQLEEDSLVIGVITLIKDFFLIVKFFNSVQGVVFLANMDLVEGQKPGDLYYLGQVVNCRVVKVNADERKLNLSFKLTREKKKRVPIDLTIGEVFGVKIATVGEDSFRVVLKPGMQTALLPFSHLSDYPEVQKIRKLTFRKGQSLPKVTFFNTTKGCTVTMKESILKCAEENSLVKTFEDLEVGMLVPAVVNHIQEFGVFMELAGGFTGLCPIRTIPKQYHEGIQNHFPVGRSLLTRIVSVDQEKKRFLGAIMKHDCIEGDSDKEGLNYLQHYLETRDRASKEWFLQDEKNRLFEKFKVGSVTQVTVMSVHSLGALCEVEPGVKAIASVDHAKGVKLSVGKQYRAVVLDVDVMSPCLEVALDPGLTKSVDSLKKASSSSLEVKPDQTLKAKTVLVKPEFHLMNLRGHGTGKFVYVPILQHMNDIGPHAELKKNTTQDVTIKGKFGGCYIGIFKSRKSKSSAKQNLKEGAVEKENIDLKNLPLHNVQTGDVIEAEVTFVHPSQMNIKSKRCFGRVSITEVSDDIDEKKNPLATYKTGDKITVKVIGLQTFDLRYMALDNHRATRSLLECSLRQSKMDITDKDKLLEEQSISIGTEVVVYVTQLMNHRVYVQASLSHKGYVSFFFASKNVAQLNNPEKYFQPGQPFKATVIGKDENDLLIFSFIGPVDKPTEGGEVTVCITGGGKASDVLSVLLYQGQRGLIKDFSHLSEYKGNYIRCEVDSVTDGVYHLKPKGQPKGLKRKATQIDTDNDFLPTKKGKSDQIKKDKPVIIVKPKVQQEKSEEKDKRLSIEGFGWGEDFDLKSKRKEVSHEDVDDDDDDDDTTTGKTMDDGKLKKKKKRDEERTINEYEKQQLDGNTAPQNENEFERLVLQSPNSSVVWLGYMAYHLGLGEVSKAKNVAEKALDTIAFREEQEKKNVWLAYLNLEVTYGESEDLKSLLQRAITYNDPLDIYLKMCDIYVGANRIEDADQQYNILIRKFKNEKVVWKSYAQFLYKQSRLDTARNILKRCLNALDKRDHVEVISRFANLEYSHGNPERGNTMFENLLATYPGRTDIWSVYIDMVVKSDDIDGARQLLIRATKQKMNTKKLSFLIQKFIKFEESHGTEEQVQKVKDLAVSLLES